MVITKEEEKTIDETLERLGKETPFQDKTEVGEVFANLDENKHLSKNTRLNEIEISKIMIIKELQRMGILPPEVNLPQEKMELNISQKGKGREEKVQISSASRHAELQGKSGGFFSNLLRPRE